MYWRIAEKEREVTSTASDWFTTRTNQMQMNKNFAFRQSVSIVCNALY